MGNLVVVGSREANLKRQIRKHLHTLGFTKAKDGSLQPPDSNKDTYRQIHWLQRSAKLSKNKTFLEKRGARLLKYFADGFEVNPACIKPRLELIKSMSWQSDLFRLAALYWSVPVSEGFGRRMRFLVWDEQNGKLMGLIALGDPVFNLKARDSLIGWDTSDRAGRLVNVMDAYVLGALPPYNKLLCGKLVACLVKSREVAQAFREKYSNSVGVISGERKNASLLAVTTSSALGRSSVYNRLKLGGEPYLTSIGFTAGWGHFHVPDDLFAEMRSYLEYLGDSYSRNHGFGEGPNWRLRAIKKVLTKLGLNDNLMRHGLSREVFISLLARNAVQCLRGEASEADYSRLLSVAEISDLAVRRWVIPRASRNQEYKNWKRADLVASFRTLSDSQRTDQFIEEKRGIRV